MSNITEGLKNLFKFKDINQKSSQNKINLAVRCDIEISLRKTRVDRAGPGPV